MADNWGPLAFFAAMFSLGIGMHWLWASVHEQPERRLAGWLTVGFGVIAFGSCIAGAAVNRG